jgi:hypothetical protein
LIRVFAPFPLSSSGHLSFNKFTLRFLFKNKFFRPIRNKNYVNACSNKTW